MDVYSSDDSYLCQNMSPEKLCSDFLECASGYVRMAVIVFTTWQLDRQKAKLFAGNE